MFNHPLVSLCWEIDHTKVGGSSIGIVSKGGQLWCLSGVASLRFYNRDLIL
jgi:hypothetical protein